MNISTIVRCVTVILPATLMSSVLPAQQQAPSIPWIQALGEALRGGQPLDNPLAERTFAPTVQSEPAKKEATWLKTLAAGQRLARAEGKPLLVRAGADWCAVCRAQEKQIAEPEIQAALAGWVCVYVDVDASEDAKQLDITAVPTLAILKSTGERVVTNVGAVSAKELVGWLNEHRKSASTAPDRLLVGSGQLSAADVTKLAAQLADRDPAIRQASIRRLLAHPGSARKEVVEQFADGNLGVRLAAMELLQEWKAPLGDVDPWRPETLTDERVAALRKWSELPTLPVPKKPGEISDAQRKEAGREINRMLGGTDQEAAAIREQLARHGSALSDEVYQRLARATTDRERERLLALRYRLVAADTLVLRWPDGLTRLAATDSRQRQKAAEELAELAGAPELELLLELFSDSDPLVRELSLLGLQRIGGKQATAALVRLLADPEPNVRAAVLKQLTESPSAELAPKVAAYMKGEKDADLLVHAIRFMRVAGGEDATRSLLAVLEHESWQVRAEAAEALGNVDSADMIATIQSATNIAFDDSDAPGLTFRADDPVVATPGDESLAKQVQAAVIKLLDDEDAFVVSRALESLSSINTPDAVEPLVRAAEKHPKLAAQIVVILAGRPALRAKALPHLREFAKHEDPAIRAASVAALRHVSPSDIDRTLLAGLSDSDATVRITTASATFELLEEYRSNAMKPAPDAEAGWVQSEGYSIDPFAEPFDEPIEVRETTTTRLMRLLGETLRNADAPEVQAADDRGDEPPALPLLDGPPDVPPSIPSIPEIRPEDLLDSIPSHDAPILPPKPSRTEDSTASARPSVSPPAVPAPATEWLPTVTEPRGNIEVPEEPYNGLVPVPSPPVRQGQLRPVYSSPVPEPPSIRSGEMNEDLPRGEAWDKWLKSYYAGAGLPDWANIAIGPLEKMLQAEDVRERLAAARTLVPLGKAEVALPVLLDPKSAHSERFATAGAVLPWLPWDQRLKTFRQLRELAKNGTQLQQLVYMMIKVSDHRMVDELWGMLTDDKITSQFASAVNEGLMGAYVGEQTVYGSSAGDDERQELIKVAEAKAAAGTEWQRVVAMAILLDADEDVAGRVAQKIAEDERLSYQLRLDAFEVGVVAGPEDARTQRAVTALAGDDVARRKLALAGLANNSQASLLRGIQRFASSDITYRRGEPIITEPPEGLKPEHVRPSLQDSDRLNAAYAGYLLAIMGEPEGLEPLLSYWRRPADNGAEHLTRIARRVTRAIAALDDSSQIAVLREIHKQLKSTYDIRDFYWTIRTMTGAEIREFREKIREQIGAENLD